MMKLLGREYTHLYYFSRNDAEAYCIVNDLKWREMEETIGSKEAERLWLVYAERINLHYKRTEGLEAQLKAMQDERDNAFAECRAIHKIENERAIETMTLKRQLKATREVLEQIAKGEGRFSQDHFQHCKNTVEDMKDIAIKALAGVYEDKD